MKNLLDLVFKAVGLAMGVAVVVLSILGSMTPETGVLLLGIGLASLGIAALDNATEVEEQGYEPKNHSS